MKKTGLITRLALIGFLTIPITSPISLRAVRDYRGQTREVETSAGTVNVYKSDDGKITEFSTGNPFSNNTYMDSNGDQELDSKIFRFAAPRRGIFTIKREITEEDRRLFDEANRGYETGRVIGFDALSGSN